MIYCISDIHGMQNLFEQMLAKIDLKQGDTLYVLGDCIDRGGGLSTLRHVMELQRKGLAQFIKGNHEIVFENSIRKYDPNMESKLYLSYLGTKPISERTTFFETIFRLINTCGYLQNFKDAVYSAIAARNLSSNCSYYSAEEYFKLPTKEQDEIISFIQNAPTYVDISVSGKKYRLTHAGCEKDGSISVDIRDDFYTQKSPIVDATVVFGHTTTKDIRIETEHIMEKPTIWYDKMHANDKIGIDCGAPFENGLLGCLRLDDMTEFYVENDSTPQSFISVYNDYARKTRESVISRGYTDLIATFIAKIGMQGNSPQEIGERINNNIDSMKIPESVKDKLKFYLRMIHNYTSLVKLHPTNKKHTDCLMEYTRKAKKLCNQYSIDIKNLFY